MARKRLSQLPLEEQIIALTNYTTWFINAIARKDGGAYTYGRWLKEAVEDLVAADESRRQEELRQAMQEEQQIR